MVLLPLAEQLGKVELTVGVGGAAAAGATLNGELGGVVQLFTPAVTV